MKKYFIAAAMFLPACVVAPSAHATEFLTITGPSGTFGDDTVACAMGTTGPCNFSRTFQFMTPTGFNLTSATISSIMSGNNQLTNIDFSSVTLNGAEFTNVISDGSEFRNLFNQPLSSGALNTIFVQGTTGGEGSFSGTLSFAAVAAVPEPESWAMMIIGFGVVGSSLRRRSRSVGLEASRPA